MCVCVCMDSVGGFEGGGHWLVGLCYTVNGTGCVPVIFHTLTSVDNIWCLVEVCACLLLSRFDPNGCQGIPRLSAYFMSILKQKRVGGHDA